MKAIIIAGVAILAVFLLVLYFIPLGVEPLTEVYFENHTKIPVNIFLNKTYNYSFTVHNLEYQGMNYSYDIRAEYNNKTVELDYGKFHLDDGGNVTFFKNYSFMDHFDRAKIQIAIKKVDVQPLFRKKLWWPDPNYPTEIDIHFWVDEVKGTTITITPD